MRGHPGLAAAAALVVFLVWRGALAHALAFGELRLQARAGGQVVTVLRVDRAVDTRALDVSLGPRCRPDGPSRWGREGDTVVAHRGFKCGTWGLDGAQVSLEGAAKGDVQVIVTTVHPDGTETRGIVRGSGAAAAASPGALETLAEYVRLGVEHIALGFDHLAFVLGLLLLSLQARRGVRGVLTTITAFTVGHSITLGLTVLGLVTLRSAPVEVLIAASIVLIALELVRDVGGRTLAQRRPWLIATGFGALHGFGFAGALREVGLPAESLGTALLGFNLGVELGQIAFVSLCLLVLVLLRRREAVPQRGARWVGYGLGALACAWFIERLTTMLGGMWT